MRMVPKGTKNGSNEKNGVCRCIQASALSGTESRGVCPLPSLSARVPVEGERNGSVPRKKEPERDTVYLGLRQSVLGKHGPD